MLEAVRGVRLDEERIGVGQVVVDYVTFRHAHALQSIDIVVGGSNTEVRHQQTLCHELKLTRNDQFHATQCDDQTTLIDEACDVDQRIFERGFVQVCRSGRLVGKSATAGKRVRSITECYTVAAGSRACGESVARTEAALTCFVCHRTGEARV